MTEPRLMASAATLPNGDVLPDAPTLPAVAALPDGRVLVAGGEVAGSTVGTAVLYRPATRSWQDAGTTPVATAGAAVAVLSNGQVLVAGGADVTATPGGHPMVTAQSAAAVYSPPAGSSVRSGTRPVGVPMPVVSSSPLLVALGSAGGAVILVGLAFWAYERRRRRVAVQFDGPPDPQE